MPRANRSFLPGYVWHITHRCHDRQFLLASRDDRDHWRRWLYEATKRYELHVLTFTVTSNHVHLLVQDARGDGTLARAMQLVQGRTAQAFNHRRGRRGAFWQDRYHAVAVETDAHLWRCLVYIDLNMVRAGVVRHPGDWRHGAYREIQSPRQRYRVVDLDLLAALTGCESIPTLQRTHRDLLEAALARGHNEREPEWTESVAVGSDAFTRTISRKLGLSRRGRFVHRSVDSTMLREAREPYTPRMHASAVT